MTSLDSLRAAAADEAAATGSGFVGSEHLFLAWLALGTGPAFDAAAAAPITTAEAAVMAVSPRTPSAC